MFRKLRTNRRPSPSTPLVKYLSEGREMEMALAPVAGTRLLASQSPHATGSSSRTTELREVSFRGYVGDVCGACCREGCHRGYRRARGAGNPPDHQRDGGKVPRHRDWHGAAHLRRASDESARGGAMSKGRAAPSPRSVPSKVICDALGPLGGTFVLGISLMPPLPKTCPKMVLPPKRG